MCSLFSMTMGWISVLVNNSKAAVSPAGPAPTMIARWFLTEAVSIGTGIIAFQNRLRVRKDYSTAKFHCAVLHRCDSVKRGDFLIHKNPFPIQLNARFARYALLTGATILAAKPARGDVVFTLVPATDFTSGVHTLDVNDDSIPDYIFSGFGTSAPEVRVLGLSVISISSSFANTDFTGTFSTALVNRVAFAGDTGLISAVAFGTGEVIGTSLSWEEGVAAGMSAFGASGPLFLGLQFFDTNGAIHYGFAESDPWNFDGFAFETLANTSITTFDLTTPEPGSLGMLALGAAGIEILRRKRANRA